ncbi:hypothetical protein PIB30_077741 [Stylosanthes scabra]|uniref:Uncharacterized protein n=1 Tax=Stylosanthes scabra TaxID=79078 RepID=A0ABU6UQ18_9FABA|nr:hypothetical protein [Stylosanthes scabra]
MRGAPQNQRIRVQDQHRAKGRNLSGDLLGLVKGSAVPSSGSLDGIIEHQVSLPPSQHHQCGRSPTESPSHSRHNSHGHDLNTLIRTSSFSSSSLTKSGTWRQKQREHHGHQPPSSCLPSVQQFSTTTAGSGDGNEGDDGRMTAQLLPCSCRIPPCFPINLSLSRSLTMPPSFFVTAIPSPACAVTIFFPFLSPLFSHTPSLVHSFICACVSGVVCVG